MSSNSVPGLLEVKECPHGRGAYARRDFGPGEHIWTFHDISFTTAPTSPPWKRWAMIVGKTSEGKDLFWDEAPENSPEYWSNFLDHDENPNVRFVIDMENLSARLVTTRTVRAGEEFFLDYKEYSPKNWAPS